MRFAFAIPAVVALAACLADRSLPVDVGARTPCHANGDCPSGFVCPAGGDVCLSTSAHVCGNGKKDPGEECDDGNLVGGDGCRADCTLEKCGDGIVDKGEACDDGAGKNGAATPGACSADCTKRSACGDGHLDPGESCDDGNNTGGDGCSAACAVEACGNGVVDVGEACDDGNTTGGDGCSSDCKKVEVCGDLVVDTGEECDDGNDNPDDGCDQCHRTTWDATVLAGLGALGSAVRVDPIDVAVDLAGNAYVLEPGGLVLKIEPTRVTPVLDRRQVPLPPGYVDQALRVDAFGRVLLASSRVDDSTSPATVFGRIERADPASGVVEHIAGSDDPNAPTGNAADANAVRLSWRPEATGVLAFDASGNIVIADFGALRVRKLDVESGALGTLVGGSALPDDPVNAGTSLPLVDGPAGGTAVAPVSVAATPGGIAFTDERATAAASLLVSLAVVGGGTVSVLAGGSAVALSSTPAERTAVALPPIEDLAFVDGVAWLRARFVGLIRIDDTTAATASGFGAFPGTPVALSTFFANGPLAATAGHALLVGAPGWLLSVDTSDAALTTTAIAGDGKSPTDGDGEIADTVALAQAAGAFTTNDETLVVTPTRLRSVDANGVLGTAASDAFLVDACVSDGRVLALTSADQVVDVSLTGITDFSETATIPTARVEALDLATGATTVLVGGNNANLTGLWSIKSVFPPAVDVRFNYSNAVDQALFLAPAHISCLADGRIVVVTSDQPVARANAGVIGTVDVTSPPTTFVMDLAANSVVTTVVPSHGAALAPDDGSIVVGVGSQLLRINGPSSGFVAAGTGALGFLDGDAASALFGDIADLANGSDGSILVADPDNARVRRVALANDALTVSTFAGDPANVDGSGDGLGPLAAGIVPTFVDVSAGTVFVGEADRVRAISPEVVGPTQKVATLVGPVEPRGTGPFSSGFLTTPRAIAVDGSGRYFVAGGTAGTIVRVDPSTQLIEHVAGIAGGVPPSSTPVPARSIALFRDAAGVAYDAAAHLLYVADAAAARIAVVSLPDEADATTWTATSTTLDGGVMIAPHGLALSSDGASLFVADAGAHRVWSVPVDGSASPSVVAGLGLAGFFGEGVDAKDAVLDAPEGVAIAADGSVFIADTGNERVRRVDDNGVIATVLGDGSAASEGDGAPASAFSIDSPIGMAFDVRGNLVVAGRTAVRLVLADADGIVRGDGAVLTIFGAQPKTPPADLTSCVQAIAVLGDGVVHATDACLGLVIELDRK